MPLLICFRAPLTLSSFSGSAVRVYGASQVINGIGSPTWECFIDDLSNSDASVSVHAAPNSSQNNLGLCYGEFADGNHTLTVTAQVPDGQNFYLDRIEYVPSANASLNESLVRVDSSDAAVSYSDNWHWVNEEDIVILYSGNVHTTSTNGSWLTIDFSGS